MAVTTKPDRAGLWAGAFAAAVLVGAAAPSPSAYDVQAGAAKASMMAEPQKAFDHAKAALQAAGADPVKVATADWLAGEALTRMKRPAEALTLLDRVLPQVRKAAPGGKLEGDVLRSHGRAAAALGKVQTALSDFQAAYGMYQRAGEARSQAIALQEIGGIYLDARDYPHVLQYYAQAKDAFGEDPSLNLAANNNLGIAYKEMGKAREAEGAFRDALKAAADLESGALQAQILANVAFAESLAGKREGALADSARGLAIAARDPEARDETPFLIGVQAKVAADEGRYPAAAALLDTMFKGADLTATTPDYRDFHEVAARVYEKTGDHARALAHLKAFKRLDDDGRTLAASTNAALMSARFDFANQTLRISQLKAGQLERDIALARSRARLTAVITGALLLGGAAALTVSILGFLAMRRSRDKISAANTALQKALKAKTEFLATTSHEIRTPLNGILGMAQVILADNDAPPATRERVKLMLGAGSTMRALVDDLLDMAKIETGAIVLESAPLSPARVLSETLQFWTDQAALKGVALKLDMQDLPMRVIGDETRLRQVLFNLMSNAVKFTEQGQIAVGAGYDGDVLTVTVSDTGVGIPADKQELIFEAFAQADQSTSRQYGGVGLGLAICRNICAAMRGGLTVQSAVGEGSTFTLTLPLPRDGTLDAAPAADLASACLLVVDPNPLSRNVVRALLEPKVRRVEAVAAMTDAVERLRFGGADVLVIEAKALQGDGLGLAASVDQVRIAVLSAPDDAQAAAQLPGARVIMKPMTGQGLLSALEAMIADSTEAAPPVVRQSA